MSKRWPSTPLSAAQRAFTLLTCPPAPLAFDGRGFSGLPQRILPLDELKTVLITDTTPRPVRDAVWRELVCRARRDGPEWVIAAVGVAMPGLRAMAGLLARGWRGDIRDRDAELLTGFVTRLNTIDVDAPRICGRLIDAGARAVKRAQEQTDGGDTVAVAGAWSLPPSQPWDHPDWVLARAVATGVIGPEEHQLIGDTRLEDRPLRSVAEQLGVSVAVAASWRRKAERRLAVAIADGDLAWVSLVGDANSNKMRRPASVGYGGEHGLAPSAATG